MTLFKPTHCGKCGAALVFTGTRTRCPQCHLAYMRAWRKSHPLSAEQKHKDTARSIAGVYLRRGKIEKQPCRDCGSAKSQMHHEDYDKPLEVIWLCRQCHMALHAREREEWERQNAEAFSELLKKHLGSPPP